MKSFDEISAYTSKNIFAWTNTLVRASGFPIDKWSVFGSYEAAKQYVQQNTDIPGMGDATALPYAGQLIAVFEDGIQSVYVLDDAATDGLRKLATGGDADEIAKQLAELSGSLLSVGGTVDQLSNAISTITSTTLPNLSTELSTSLTDNLSVTMTSEEGAEGILKVYTIKQGGKEVGKIDIPKDLVIETAGVVDFVAGQTTITINGKNYTVKGDHETGKYIVMIVAVTEDQLWILAKDLVDIYTGGSTTTITVGVDSLNVITATVNAGSITRNLLSTDLTLELDGLRTDINTVSTDLGSEVTRAKGIESELSNAISAEVERAIGAETALNTAITTEVERATDAEEDLETAIGNEETRAKGIEDDLSDAIDAEVTRATAKEGELNAAITAEETRATGSETVLSGMVNGEINRATIAETTLGNRITTEETARENADSILQTNIDTLSTTMDTKISNEMSRAKGVEEALDTRLTTAEGTIVDHTTKINKNSSDISFLSTSLDEEADQRQKDDAFLSAAIGGVSSNYATKEELEAEETARKENDSFLSTEVVALSNYLTGTYETKEDATTKYNELTGKINTEETRAKASESVLSGMINDEVQRSSNYDTFLSNALTSETNRATTSETALSGMVNTEKARAEGVETYLSNAISTEINDRKDNDSFLSGKIDDLNEDLSDNYETKEDATTKYNELTNKIDVEETARKNADNALSTWSYDTFIQLSALGTTPTETNKLATIADVVGLSGVVHFRGADPNFNGTGTPNTPWYNAGHTPQEGDIVINTTTSKEYLFANETWLEMGDEKLYATKEELSAEKEARENDDAYLSGAISAEVDRAEKSETVLSGMVEDEAERALASETVLSGMVNAEKERAEKAEDDLSKAIEAEETRATASETVLSGMVNTEKARAEGVEGDLADAIEAETTRAIQSETILSGMIEDEVVRATAKENALSDEIILSVSTLEGSATSLSTDTSIAGAKVYAATKASEALDAAKAYTDQSIEDIGLSDYVKFADVATTSKTGVVKSSTADNKVSVDASTGEMTVNTITETETVSTAALFGSLELNGGNANGWN